MSYDVILFDLDDTLFDFQTSQSLSLQHVHREFYATTPLSDFSASYREINTKLWQRVGAKSNALMPQDVALLRFELLNQKFKINHLDVMQVAESYETALAQTAAWLPGAKDTIELLHKHNYILGVVTNGLRASKRYKYQLHELHRWFQAYIISDEVGISKPEKAIFDIALNQVADSAQIKRKEIQSVLMVGDSLASDGCGARNADLHFCWVTPGNTMMQPQGVPVHYQVQSVAELPKKII